MKWLLLMVFFFLAYYFSLSRSSRVLPRNLLTALRIFLYTRGFSNPWIINFLSFIKDSKQFDYLLWYFKFKWLSIIHVLDMYISSEWRCILPSFLKLIFVPLVPLCSFIIWKMVVLVETVNSPFFLNPFLW